MSTEKTANAAPVDGIVMQPDSEGWYWHRASDQHQWACVEVYREDGYWWWSPQRQLIDNAYAMENHIGEHWMPIPTPEAISRVKDGLRDMVSYTAVYGEQAGELASDLLSA